MKSVKTTGKAVSKLFSLLLAVALFITFMPLGVGAAYAADAAEYQPVLTITGPDGTVTAYQTVEDATKAFNDIEDTSLVEGKTLKGIGVRRLLSDFDENAVVTVQTQDDYTGTLNANGKTVGELKNLKGILAYQDGDSPFDPTVEGTKDKGYFVFYIGKDADGNVMKDKWVNRITITDAGTEPTPDPEPAPDILTVTGKDLKKTLSYDTIKTLKNDEAIKHVDAVFKTLNSYNTAEELTVTGVTMESLIKLAGVKNGVTIESVTVTCGDGYEKTYTAKQVFNKDLDGNKAMYIWTENGDKVQKTAVGQFDRKDQNRGFWVNDKNSKGITLTVNTKKVSKPGKPSVTLKAGKKQVKVTWKKVSGAAGYEIYRSTKKTKGFKMIKTITSGKTLKYTNKKLKGKKAYYYKVRAYKKDFNGKKVYGSYSTVKKATTKK